MDQVFVAQSTQSLPATSLEQFYVSASRARERVTIYTDDKGALREAAAESGRRMSATELLSAGESPPTTVRTRIHEQLDRFRQYARQAASHARERWETHRETPSQLTERYGNRGQPSQGGQRE